MGEQLQLRLLKRGICDFASLAWHRGLTFSRTLRSVIVTLVLRCPGRHRKETHNFQLPYKTKAVQEGKWHRADCLWYLGTCKSHVEELSRALWPSSVLPSSSFTGETCQWLGRFSTMTYSVGDSTDSHQSAACDGMAMLDVLCKLTPDKIKPPDVSWPTNPHLGCTLRTHNVGAVSALTSENCTRAFPPTTAAHLQETPWERNCYKMLLKQVHVVWMGKLLYSISKALPQDINIFYFKLEKQTSYTI